MAKDVGQLTVKIKLHVSIWQIIKMKLMCEDDRKMIKLIQEKLRIEKVFK